MLSAPTILNSQEDKILKKNDIIEVLIEEVHFPNKGVVHIEGKEVVIKNAIKGQKVKVKIIKNKEDRAEGQIVEVVERAAEEVSPFCPHFGVCGGCAYQTMTYEKQLELKGAQVKKLLDDAGIRGYEYQGIEGSPNELEYRNKMEFSFGDVEKGGELALGLHKKGSFYEVVTVHGCQIVDEDFKRVLTLIHEYFREKNISFYKKGNHEGYLRHLVVRKAEKTGEMLINLVTSSQMEMDMTPLALKVRELKLDGELVGFIHTINDALSDIVRPDEVRLLFGRDYIMEEILGLKFKISAFSFFQTNSSGAEKLYSITREYAGESKDKIIFDLYSGTGTIAQIMAPVAKKVIGIEIIEEAVEAARENADLNGLSNCEFIAGDVLKRVGELKDKPDLIILDPPRDGIHPKAIGKIIDFKAPRLVYVSCKPTSLARDLQVFQERGYKVKKVKCMDMFPHTPHVETVVLIERK